MGIRYIIKIYSKNDFDEYDSIVTPISEKDFYNLKSDKREALRFADSFIREDYKIIQIKFYIEKYELIHTMELGY